MMGRSNLDFADALGRRLAPLAPLSGFHRTEPSAWATHSIQHHASLEASAYFFFAAAAVVFFAAGFFAAVVFFAAGFFAAGFVFAAGFLVAAFFAMLSS